MKRWVVAAILVASGCGKGPSEDQCRKLLEHLVDLEFKKGGSAVTTDGQRTELAKQKSAVLESKQVEFMAACVDKTHKDRVECALAAADLAAVGKCDETK